LNNDAELVATVAAAVGGGASFLTACGSSDSGKREGATSDKAAKKLLPAFVARGQGLPG
jgi:putative aldouronate transport system substrate-binding protein